MEKMKSFYPDLSNLSEAQYASLDEELDKRLDGNDPSFNIDNFYKEKGIKLIERSESKDVKSNDIEFISDGLSVNLARRAIFLTDTIELNSKSSRLGGLVKKLEKEFEKNPGDDTVFHNNKKYTLGDVLRMDSASKSSKKKGYKKFYQAFGGSEMDGYTDAYKFYDRYVGPAHAKDRNKYKTVLKNQQNL